MAPWIDQRREFFGNKGISGSFFDMLLHRFLFVKCGGVGHFSVSDRKRRE